jgi:hypothetical protein
MRAFALFTIAALAAVSLQATPCSALIPNYQSLIDAGSAGCTIGGLVFDNFTFAGSSTGKGATPTAIQTSFTLDDPGVSTGTGQQIFGFEFNPNLSIIGIGSEDEILQYDIACLDGRPCITSNHLLLTGLASEGAIGSVAEGDCGKTAAGGGCTFLPILTVTTSAPHKDALDIGPFESLHVWKDVLTASAGRNGFASISNVRDAVDESAPEPSTVALMFSGALLIGLRRFVRRS